MSDELRVTTAWHHYPFRLVPGDSALDFPAAEGLHTDQESDTWFIAGELTGATGRTFAFLTIFNKNRPGGTVVADFYTMSLFDCDTGEYGTYTDYDMPPKNMQPDARPKMSMAQGHLDIRYESSAGPVTWTTCRDDDGELRPYTYRVSLRGADQVGRPMELDLDVTPTRAPVPVGADTCNGKITCFGQDDTYSYFQTGMAMTGTLRWGEPHDEVSGSAGHVDRQWFPKYAGGGGTGGDPRSRSHEWRTINLDNGVDMSIWRQFDRVDGNAPQPFTGVTVSYPDPANPPECAEDVEITVTSYVRWPDSIRSLLRPPAPDRFMPDRHRLRCPSLELDLIGEPMVPAPAHGLPIEYMEGPFRYRGTMRGEPVSGFAFYERSLALYRDWELIDVLASTLENTDAVDQLRSLVASDNRSQARKLLQAMLVELPADDTGRRDVVEGMIGALSADN
ncbi:MAG TPA: lipocalin-like domain-containing protein [Mycobacterium sp.]|uniref:lipocalin-like domain-containing protein n=1 Tax=Mycobacterium sp. TaxID=1785 RepID=UPI002F3E8FAF